MPAHKEDEHRDYANPPEIPRQDKITDIDFPKQIVLSKNDETLKNNAMFIMLSKEEGDLFSRRIRAQKIVHEIEDEVIVIIDRYVHHVPQNEVAIRSERKHEHEHKDALQEQWL